MGLEVHTSRSGNKKEKNTNRSHLGGGEDDGQFMAWQRSQSPSFTGTTIFLERERSRQ